LAGLLVTATVPVHAGLWDDLWQRRDQQAINALERGDAARANELFATPAWQGVASYRGGAYADAERWFAQEHTAEGQYNAGNALAHEGRYADAIAAYDRALAMDPNDADARFNKALVEKLREQQKAKGQSNQQSADRSDANRRNETGSDQNRPSDRDRAPEADAREARRAPRPEQDAKPAARDQDAEREASRELDSRRDEANDALNQWLRRVPDDPGGLLRRKFQYETRERMRHGGYPPHEDQPW
jgi:Ca-activated chloride channel family protein